MSVSFGLFLIYMLLCAKEQRKLIYELQISDRAAPCSTLTNHRTFHESWVSLSSHFLTCKLGIWQHLIHRRRLRFDEMMHVKSFAQHWVVGFVAVAVDVPIFPQPSSEFTCHWQLLTSNILHVCLYAWGLSLVSWGLFSLYTGQPSARDITPASTQEEDT